MKNLKKILMLFALVIVVQNGAVIASGSDGNTGSYSSEGETAAPCSDLPPLEDNYD